MADFEIIHTYSRAQAIEDGVLVSIDATALGEDMAGQAGFKIPVAVTASVWADYIEVPEGLEGVQDVKGRLWDILWMASGAARRNTEASRVDFTVLVLNDPAKGATPRRLQMVCGPGDELEPVLTIMQLGED